MALAILGLILLFMTQILVQESFLERRTQSRIASLRLLEAHAELIRAGLPLPDEPGSYRMALLVEPPPGADVDDAEMDFTLEALEPPGLWRLDLRLAYVSSGRELEQRMEMRLWRP